MNKDILKGKWTQFKGQVKQRWGELTDDDLDKIEGRRDELIGRIQERYGYTRERAEREADSFIAEIQGERTMR
ncbi:MAG: CsbD family protein [Anaerolineae bacterium]